MKHHRIGHRFRGVLKFELEDGTDETTAIEAKDMKGAKDAFLLDVTQAIVEVVKNLDKIGNGVRITYEGDFEEDVVGMIKNVIEIGKNPEKQKEVNNLIKLYKAVDEL